MAPIENVELAPKAEPDKQRQLSVDVLRGFTMFWIVGGDNLFRALFRLLGGPFSKYLEPQLDHAVWQGFHFYDLIFPLFEFMIGMSIVFSLTKMMNAQDKKAAWRRVLKRFVLLYFLGIIYYGGISGGVEKIRLLGVLQRLALTFLITSTLFIHFRLRGLMTAFAILLVGYWAWLTFIPVPETGETSFAMGKNWANWVDMKYLPLFKWNGDWDPEGLLSTLPATGSCILGVFAALLIMNKNIGDMKKVHYFIAGGFAILSAGYLWGIQFPVIKNIWTSSYVLVGGGYCWMLLGIFHLVLDIRKIQKWAAPFIWLGVNPIAIYMTWNILNFNNLAHRFAGLKEYYTFNENFGFFCGASAALTLVLAFVRFLYKRRIFIKI